MDQSNNPLDTMMLFLTGKRLSETKKKDRAIKFPMKVSKPQSYLKLENYNGKEKVNPILPLHYALKTHLVAFPINSCLIII